MEYINKKTFKTVFFLVLIEFLKILVFAGIANIIIESIGNRGNMGAIITMAIAFVITVWVLDFSMERLKATSRIKLYVGTFRTTLNLMCIFFIYKAFTNSEFTYENMHSVELVNAVWIMLLLDQVMNIYLNRYREIKATKLSEFSITEKIAVLNILKKKEGEE